MEPFSKVVRPGNVPTWEGSPRCDLFCHIIYDEKGELHITGVEGPTRNGNCKGGCGQIEASYRTAEKRDEINLASGWTREMLDKFFDVWDRWHLNHMNAGTPEQTALLRKHRDEFPGYPVNHLDWARTLLKAHGLQPDTNYLPSGVPKGDAITPDDTGYSYGHAWLKVDVPDDVLDFLFRDVPETDRDPAWV